MSSWHMQAMKRCGSGWRRTTMTGWTLQRHKTATMAYMHTWKRKMARFWTLKNLGICGSPCEQHGLTSLSATWPRTLEARPARRHGILYIQPWKGHTRSSSLLRVDGSWKHFALICILLGANLTKIVSWRRMSTMSRKKLRMMKILKTTSPLPRNEKGRGLRGHQPRNQKVSRCIWHMSLLIGWPAAVEDSHVTEATTFMLGKLPSPSLSTSCLSGTPGSSFFQKFLSLIPA